MQQPGIQNKNNLTHGGNVTIFMTPANIDFAETELLDVGTLNEENISVNMNADYYQPRSSGFDLSAPELTSLGVELSFTLKEASATNFLKFLGFGNLTTSAAETSQVFTSQKVVCYGNNWTNLPFTRATVTTVTDNAATPTSYTAATDIEVSADGDQIRIPPTSTITTSAEGVTLLITGTLNKRETKYVGIGSDTTPASYGIRLKKKNRQGNLHYIDIFEAYRVGDIQIDYQHGEAYELSVSYRGVLDPTQSDVYKMYFETP